jgi:predicted PurR-regulated permease PerM
MAIPRRPHRRGIQHDEPPAAEDGRAGPSATESARSFPPPAWLRDLGMLAWFLVGVGLVLVGAIWLLGEISTILVLVLMGTIVAAVAGPLVEALKQRGVPRAAGAALVLLMLIALGVVVLLLVLGGIAEQGDQIRTYASQALDKVEGWAKDAGADGTSEAKNDVNVAVQGAGSTLVHGVASGIEGLTSIAFFVSFALFSTFLLLKDFGSIRNFVDTHLGIPAPVAATVTENVLSSLRRYFLGLTIVAACPGRDHRCGKPVRNDRADPCRAAHVGCRPISRDLAAARAALPSEPPVTTSVASGHT